MPIRPVTSEKSEFAPVPGILRQLFLGTWRTHRILPVSLLFVSFSCASWGAMITFRNETSADINNISAGVDGGVITRTIGVSGLPASAGGYRVTFSIQIYHDDASALTVTLQAPDSGPTHTVFSPGNSWPGSPIPFLSELATGNLTDPRPAGYYVFSDVGGNRLSQGEVNSLNEKLNSPSRSDTSVVSYHTSSPGPRVPLDPAVEVDTYFYQTFTPSIVWEGTWKVSLVDPYDFKGDGAYYMAELGFEAVPEPPTLACCTAFITIATLSYCRRARKSPLANEPTEHNNS